MQEKEQTESANGPKALLKIVELEERLQQSEYEKEALGKFVLTPSKRT